MYYYGEPHDNDVLAGRGNGANQHPGNVFFRALVAQQRNAYNEASSSNQKKKITSLIVAHVLKHRVPAGRFLEKVPRARNTWHIMVDKDIMKKTAQALRDHPKNDDSTVKNSTPTQPISVSIKAVAPTPVNCLINGTEPPEKYNPEFENSLNWDELNKDNGGSTDITNSVLNALLKSFESIDTAGVVGLADSAQGQENYTDFDVMDISTKEASLKDTTPIHKEEHLSNIQHIPHSSPSNGHSQSRNTIICGDEQWHTSTLSLNDFSEGREQWSTVSARNNQSLPPSYFSALDDRKGYEECHNPAVSTRMYSPVLSSNLNEVPQLNYQSQVDMLTKSARKLNSCSNDNN